MRKLLLTFQNPAQMSPLAKSLTPSRNVLSLLQDSQPRGLSLYPSPDNRGWVSLVLSPPTWEHLEDQVWAWAPGIAQNKEAGWSVEPSSCCPRD